MSDNDAFVPIGKLAQHFSVSVSTIRAWVKANRIPHNTYVKLGNTYRFNIPAVTAALVGKPVEDQPVVDDPDINDDIDL